MRRATYLFTSESVSEGHPDKVCDRISDTIVDAYLAEMPEARVACETLATTNRVVIAGEVRGPEAVLAKVEELARAAIKDIGYEQPGFHWRTAKIEILCSTPSPRTSRKASMPPATRTRAPATRASCSATPAARRRN